MMMPSILAAGALTAVGLSAEQTAFGLRAGLFCPRTIGHADKQGEELGAVLVPAIHEEIEGWERLVSLALPPLREVQRALGSKVARIFLALPDARAGLSAEDLAHVTTEVADAEFGGDGRGITPVFGDREAFAAALVSAKVFLEEHRDATVIVGAVDSYHNLPTYRALDDEYRLLSERSPNGFIPGEAAAFVVLSGRSHPDALSLLSFVDVKSERSEEDVLAEAFTDVSRNAARAARRALEARGETSGAPWVLLDQHIERHRNKAWQIVLHRLRGELDSDSSVLDSLAERLGDVGAASGAVLAVYASMGLASGFAPGKSALVALASDRRARAAFSLVTPGK